MPPNVSDRLDRQLIALLQSNARDSTTALAKALGVARTTVHERIQRMESNGIILGYSVVLSRNPFEQEVSGIALIDTERKNQPGIVAKLKRYPEIRTCSSTNGECDLLCQIEVPLLEDLEALIGEIANIAGVTAVRLIVNTSMKFNRQSDGSKLQTSINQADLKRGEAG